MTIYEYKDCHSARQVDLVIYTFKYVTTDLVYFLLYFLTKLLEYSGLMPKAPKPDSGHQTITKLEYNL